MRSVRPPAPRGFTLVELLIALTVSTVVVGAALLLLNVQQRSFRDGAGDRALQASGRVALESITSALRIAGYGMDPAMAFDFGAMIAPQDRAPLAPGVTGVAFGGYACDVDVECRDRTDGPDELVFLNRHAQFGRVVQSASAAELVIQGPLRAPIRRGQILQAVCYSGDMRWAYVTAARDVPADPGVPSVRIELAPGSGTDFPLQNDYLADACYASGQARVFKIERHRFLVQTYDPAGNVVPWGSPGGRPYLMLDRGLLDGAGAPLLSVVAPDVEDLQLSYVFALAPAGTQVRGATEGVRLGNAPESIDLAPASGFPTYATERLAVQRATGYPANIRAVRVAVVVRSGEPYVNTVEPVPAAGNRPATALPDVAGYRRSVFETSVAVPNMESRGPVFPTIGAAADQLNVGGG